MRQTALPLSALALTVMLAGGCASKTHWSDASLSSDSNAVRLSVISNEDSTPTSSGSMYVLGAGDALGQALFANYVAVVRANNQDDNQRVVSGESTNSIAPVQR